VHRRKVNIGAGEAMNMTPNSFERWFASVQSGDFPFVAKWNV
jgi:hypothetical protein